MDFALPSALSQSVSLVRLFELASEHGFPLLTVTNDEPHCSFLKRGGRLQWLAYCKQYGTRIDAVHVPVHPDYDITCTDAETRMGAVCNIALVMSAARELGARVVVLSITHALPRRFGSDARSAVLALHSLVETGEIMGQSLAIRNLVEPRSLQTLRAVLQEHTSPYVGFCYDSALDILADQEPYRLLEEFGRRLLAAHLADSDGRSQAGLLPFEGVVDWHRVCALLTAEGYQRTVLLNVLPRGSTSPVELLQKCVTARSRLEELLAF